jgi:hypothetical protein
MVYDIMAGSSAIRQSKTIRHFVHPKVTTAADNTVGLI